MKKSMVGALTLMVMLCFGAISFAGNLDSPAAPTSPSSAMYTLEDIYNRLDSNTQATKRSGAFTEPSAAPDSTGYTLDQVYEKAIPTQVPKTGQTTNYATGDDGDLQKGVAWPNPRFADNGDGTVTDNLTGLIWLKEANHIGTNHPLFDEDGAPAGSGDGKVFWQHALDFVAGMNAGTHTNYGYTDWRLPNVKELQSLIDLACYNPALSNDAGTGQWTSGEGSSFTGVQSSSYWSSTTLAPVTTFAWHVYMIYGYVSAGPNGSVFYVWPVRGGQ